MSFPYGDGRKGDEGMVQETAPEIGAKSCTRKRISSSCLHQCEFSHEAEEGEVKTGGVRV